MIMNKMQEWKQGIVKRLTGGIDMLLKTNKSDICQTLDRAMDNMEPEFTKLINEANDTLEEDECAAGSVNKVAECYSSAMRKLDKFAAICKIWLGDTGTSFTVTGEEEPEGGGRVRFVNSTVRYHMGGGFTC